MSTGPGVVRGGEASLSIPCIILYVTVKICLPNGLSLMPCSLVFMVPVACALFPQRRYQPYSHFFPPVLLSSSFIYWSSDFPCNLPKLVGQHQLQCNLCWFRAVVRQCPQDGFANQIRHSLMRGTLLMRQSMYGTNLMPTISLPLRGWGRAIAHSSAASTCQHPLHLA